MFPRFRHEDHCKVMESHESSIDYLTTILPNLRKVNLGVRDFVPALSTDLGSLVQRGYVLFGAARIPQNLGLTSDFFELVDGSSHTETGDPDDLEDRIIDVAAQTTGDIPNLRKIESLPLVDGCNVMYPIIELGAARKQTPAEIKVKAYSTNLTFTDMLYIFPCPDKISRMLDRIRQDENGVPACGKSIVERIDEMDNPFNESDNPVLYLEPEERNLVYSLDFAFKDHMTNTIEVTRYIHNMANLINRGRFANRFNSRMLCGIMGISADGSAISLQSHTYPMDNANQIELCDHLIELSRRDKLKSLLEVHDPWYMKGVQKPIDISNLVRLFDNLGNAWRNEEHEQTGALAAASACEGIVSVFYEAVKGRTCDFRTNFVERARDIASLTHTEELIEPYMRVYLNRDKRTPSYARNEGAHNGRTNKRLNKWTIMFYADLTKTLCSIFMGEPAAYFDFDIYARNAGLTGIGREHCATVPLDTVRRWHNSEEEQNAFKQFAPYSV
jgi:hypothetical protein